MNNIVKFLSDAFSKNDWVLIPKTMKQYTVTVDPTGNVITISTRYCLDQERWKTSVMPSFEPVTESLQSEQNTRSDNDKTVPAPFDFGTVQVLDLHKSRYITELHPSIGHQLPNLRHLILTRCDQLQRVPASICSLEFLHELDFTDSPMIEALPENIGNLKSLKRLIFGGGTGHHNKVLQCLPQSLGDLENLEELVLDKCKALQSIPSSIGQLSKLRYLSMKECKAVTELPDSIGFCTNLIEVSLLKCNNLVRLPNTFGQLKSLEDLNLAKCSSLEVLPDAVSGLQNLAFLSLRDCNRLKELPRTIDQLPSLYHLDCKGCGCINVDDEAKLRSLFPNLKVMELS